MHSQASLVSEHVLEAKRGLVELMAREAQAGRELAKLTARIASLESSARQALEIGEHELAQEAAERVAALESERRLREEADRQFSSRVAELRAVVLRLERRARIGLPVASRWLDRLEAWGELETGADLELERKMRAAGIGPDAGRAEEILDRVRAEQGR